MKRLLHTGCSLFVSVVSVYAQTGNELQQAMLDLRHGGRIMNVSAHPDDEDGATLAYYRMKFGVKTFSLFFTRGEGGQNEIGPELYGELGVLRTDETHAASILQGTQAHFMNLVDFGYSRTATETFAKWGGKREVLRRLLYFIRKFKPDILFTNHTTIDGHGHHQAVGISLIEAFDAAADSTAFPEQLSLPGISVWQPRKLYVRNFGRTDPSADVVNMIGEIHPALGKSYLDLAADALAMHRSQGMDRADLRRFTRGLSLYKLVRANSTYQRDTTTFFGGIDLFADPSMRELAELRESLVRMSPSMAFDSLVSNIAGAVAALDKVRGEHLPPAAARVAGDFHESLDYLAQLVVGIVPTVTLDDSVWVRNQRVRVVLDVRSSRLPAADVTFDHMLPEGWSLLEHRTSSSRARTRHEFTIRVGESPFETLPRTVAIYNPIEWEQNITVRVGYTVDGNSLCVTVPVPFDIAPPHTIEIDPSVTRLGLEGRKFRYRVRNYMPHKSAGTVSVSAPRGWMIEQATFTVAEEDGEATGEIHVCPPLEVEDGTYPLHFRTEYASTVVKARVFDAKVAPGVGVGVVRSYDDALQTALDALKVSHTLLDASDLAHGDLSRYATIVADIRAYLVREDLRKNNARLLDYVRDGGHLIVMYQKDQEWKPEYAPYPFSITRQRITVEDARVEVLHPDHPLFTTPNRVVAADWDGWIQERGVYFPGNVPAEYLQLISSHDPEMPPLSTGYLFAPVGKGSYIYTSLVWYRQLKEFHPGAFRCFANMISYPATRR